MLGYEPTTLEYVQLRWNTSNYVGIRPTVLEYGEIWGSRPNNNFLTYRTAPAKLVAVKNPRNTCVLYDKFDVFVMPNSLCQFLCVRCGWTMESIQFDQRTDLFHFRYHWFHVRPEGRHVRPGGVHCIWPKWQLQNVYKMLQIKTDVFLVCHLQKMKTLHHT